MKKNILICLLMASVLNAFSQLQNPSFENWDSGDPAFWSTSDFYSPGSATQSTDVHGGAFALRLKVVNDSTGVPQAPYAINNFSLTTMPQVLTFWMKGNLATNNNLNASFSLTELDTTVLAYGDQTFNSINNVYQYKIVNVLDLEGPSLLGQGNIFLTIISSVGGSLNVNSDVLIDDLYLGPDNTGIADFNKNNSVIEKLYPSPAQEMAYLVFNQPQYGKVSLKVYDLLGNLVQVVIDENMPAGRYKAEINTLNLNEGIYFCNLQIDGMTYIEKLTKH